jgi:hypothetical protein
MNTTPDKNGLPRFKDVSRYTRWINSLDEKDKALSPVKRKNKWLFLMGILFLLFVLSFALFPFSGFKHKSLSGPNSVLKKNQVQPAAHPFEMPADSFEQFLKSRIHENISEEK